MNISSEDLEKDGGAIMYFREYGDKKIEDEEDSNMYTQRIMRVGMCKEN
jgi:hypothetical protein